MLWNAQVCLTMFDSLQDRQGIAKQIYRGVIFMYDQNYETENGGYFCSKAQMCEKIKLSFDACSEKVMKFEWSDVSFCSYPLLTFNWLNDGRLLLISGW